MTMAIEPTEPERQRPRYDWTARTRSTAFDARRYTKFVIRMKRVTALSAFAVIFAVLAFFFVARAPRQLQLSYEKLGTLENDLAMVKPRLSGVDAQGNPYVITAKLAVQDAKNPKHATLQTIEADLTTKQGWLNARAAHGDVDMNAQHLVLNGGIDVFTDTGYALHTDHAGVDLKHNIVTGDSEVSGQGPLGTMRADRFRYDHLAGRLTLLGHVRTVINRRVK
jgi:lipopolysaccharide export system protein LptC